MTMPHTACQRNKWVWVRLKDGTVFRDQFLERTPGKWVVFKRRGRIHAGKIASFTFRDVRRKK